MYACMYVRICVNILIFIFFNSVMAQDMYTYINIYIYIYIYICVCVCVCVCACYLKLGAKTHFWYLLYVFIGVGYKCTVGIYTHISSWLSFVKRRSRNPHWLLSCSWLMRDRVVWSQQLQLKIWIQLAKIVLMFFFFMDDKIYNSLRQCEKRI